MSKPKVDIEVILFLDELYQEPITEASSDSIGTVISKFFTCISTKNYKFINDVMVAAYLPKLAPELFLVMMRTTWRSLEAIPYWETFYAESEAELYKRGLNSKDLLMGLSKLVKVNKYDPAYQSLSTFPKLN